MAPHSCWLHKSITCTYFKFTPAATWIITSLLHLNCADGLLTTNNSIRQCRCYNLEVGKCHIFIFLSNQVSSVLLFEVTSIAIYQYVPNLVHLCHRLLKNPNLNRIHKRGKKKNIFEEHFSPDRLKLLNLN